MPPINPANAIAAYSNTARAAVPTSELKPQIGQTFSNLVENAAEQALSTTHAAEKVSLQAVAGKADLTDVVTGARPRHRRLSRHPQDADLTAGAFAAGRSP